MNRQEVCVEIVKCMENVWSENILYDFIVKVQDETIQCHRFLLAACSEFFKALFRSGMKEVTENCVVLKDVSCEVFRLIINTIYTGTSLLTLDNFIEVWQAVHMLQINFLVNVCEEFAIGAIALDTWVNIYETAKLLGSEKAIEHLKTFMLTNFEKINISTTFLQMSFNEVQDLIKSQDLVINKEDVVLDSVIRWVEYDPGKKVHQYLIDNFKLTNANNDLKAESVADNENKETANGMDDDMYEVIDTSEITRKEIDLDQSINCLTMVDSPRKVKLAELLMQVKTCLVSPAVLSRILKTKLFSENEESREIIVDAMSHHTSSFRHGQWPSAAIHRSCSGFTNAGVYAYYGGFFAVLTAYNEEYFCVTKCTDLEENIQLVTFDDELYATGKQHNQPNKPCRMFVFCDNNWQEVMEMPSHNLLLVSHGDFIYILNKQDGFIYMMNPKKRKPNLEQLTAFPENVDVQHTMITHDFLLLFCCESYNNHEETAVHAFDLSSKTWSRLDNLDGPAEDLISFRSDKYTYILQTNGCVWLILQSPYDANIAFVSVAKLWNCEKFLHGALTFKGKLIILGQHPKNDPVGMTNVSEIPDHFTSVRYWGIDDCSNFVPITIANNVLIPFNTV